jgi:hypothetical protein
MSDGSLASMVRSDNPFLNQCAKMVCHPNRWVTNFHVRIVIKSPKEWQNSAPFDSFEREIARWTISDQNATYETIDPCQIHTAEP